MSCSIIHPINSGMKMYWSVQRCIRNSIFKNKKLIHCQRENKLIKSSYESCAIIKLPRQGTSKSYTSPQFRDSHLCLPSFLTQTNHLTRTNNVYYCTKPSQVKPEENKNKKEAEMTVVQRLKQLWKEYWYVLFPVHAVTSIFWYGSFYYLVVSGIDIPALLESLGAPESWSATLKNSQAGNFVLAYTLYKVATPVRYTVTIAGTTLSVNKLKQWGWIRPAPTAEQIKQMCRDKKEAFRGLKATYQDKMQVTKDEFLKSKNAMSRQFAEVQEELHRSIRETGAEFKAAAEDYKYIKKVYEKRLRDRNDGHRNSFDEKK